MMKYLSFTLQKIYISFQQLSELNRYLPLGWNCSQDWGCKNCN